MTPETCPTVAIVLLAAGQSSRMGGKHHKLLAEFDGIPLVRRMAMIASSVAPRAVVVVTGHRHQEIAACLSGLTVEVAYNKAYASGMASSIVTGFGASSVAAADGVMIMLADMPEVSERDLLALVTAFQDAKGSAIVRAVSNGKRGNPVILPQSLHARILALEGDVGARNVIEGCGLPVVDVEIGAAAHIDVDTPEAVVAAGGVLKG